MLGYYVGYQISAYPIAQIDWSTLTHIAFAPMRVKSDLSLDRSFYIDDVNGPLRAQELATAAHSHNVKALLMLGGTNAGVNIGTAASPPYRASFVTALLDAMDDLGYDGIDLDWEDNVNLDDLVALAQALRAQRPSMLLTYPGGAINKNIQPVPDPRYVTLAASLNQFNVQTYYPATAQTSTGWSSWFSSALSGSTSTTPTAIDDTLQRYAAAGIPKAKLGMGLAFYAICYTGAITGPGQPLNGAQIVGGDNNYPLSDFFRDMGTYHLSPANRQRDSIAQEPYLSFSAPISDLDCSSTNTTQYITYEDEISIAAKGAFKNANGYGGVIVWTIQQGALPPNAADGRAQNALLQALKNAFL